MAREGTAAVRGCRVPSPIPQPPPLLNPGILRAFIQSSINYGFERSIHNHKFRSADGRKAESKNALHT
jgi:hypothetical protein